MTTLDFHVRRATHTDLSALEDVHFSSVSEIAPSFYADEVVKQWSLPRNIEKYREDMDEMGGVYFVAESNIPSPLILGYAVYADRDNQHNLQALYVRGTQTRKGVGRALSQAVEDYALINGAKELHLEGTLSAEDFYKSFGFVEINRQTSPFNADSSVTIETILMKKIIGR